MCSLWSTWTTNVHTQHIFVNCCALSMALLRVAKWVVLVTGDCSSCKAQHPGTYMEREESNRENLGGNWVSSPHPNERGATELLSVHFSWYCTENMFLPSSSCIHKHFYTCLVPVETKAIRHLIKYQILFSLGVKLDFWFSESVVFNPIRCFG